MRKTTLLAVLASLTAGCDATVTGYQIVDDSGATPSAVNPGDVLQLRVVQVKTNGKSEPLSDDAHVVWSGAPAVAALPPGSTAEAGLPAPGAAATAVFLTNPGRPEHRSLQGALTILDPGTTTHTLTVTATVTGGPVAGAPTATVTVGPVLQGDATRGAALYGGDGASCNRCHGATGQGTPVGTGGKYVIDGTNYDFPAPGLNAKPDHVAADPAWNAAVLAWAIRVDVDDGAVTQRYPMPDYASLPVPPSNKPLTTQDIADIYAFLKTQTN